MRGFLAHHWEAVAALAGVGVLYALLAGSLRVLPGPRLLLLGVAGVTVGVFVVLHALGQRQMARWLGIGATAGSTLVIADAVRSLALLPSADLPRGHEFFINAALIWLLNVVVFALWYWEIDGGGPVRRRSRPYRSTDFAFPQFQLDDPTLRASWQPNGWDYLFLAFNTSTAFSPADTMVLSRTAKALMMAQSLTSLVVVSVLVGRGVSAL